MPDEVRAVTAGELTERHGVVPGGQQVAPLVGWFVACLPLAFLAWLLRRRLMGWSLLPPAAGLAALVSLAAFALYLRVMLGA